MTYTFSDLFFTRSATFLGTPLDGHETLGGYTMFDYLSVYVSRRALKPSRATLRQLLIRVRLSTGIETLQSYTSPTTYPCISLDGHETLQSYTSPTTYPYTTLDGH
jgi:hypothetical protein